MDWLTKQKTYVWFIIFLVVINLATLIFLWFDRSGSKNDFEHGPRRTDNFLKAELGLTDEQDKLMKDSRDRFFDSSGKIMNEMDQLKKQLRSEAFNQNPDSISVDSITARIGILQSQTEELAFKHFKELNSILNSEQSKKFQEIFNRDRKHPHDHNGKHPPPTPFGNPPSR